MSVPSVAASSIAARLSSRARARGASPVSVRKPPRHRLVTARPVSRISRAARSTPYFWTGARQRPTAVTPSFTHPSASSGRDHCLMVSWLTLSRDSGWAALIAVLRGR
ncbi:hypothetical protein SALBM135S_03070 [Streptomyces alboniger]